MTLYPTSQQRKFDLDIFRNPPAEYRGVPFWSWNCKLDRDQLLRQIDIFKAMGLGGFHMHSRTGLDTEYLGDEFMAHIRACVEKAEREGLRAWLYDEDRWPSGTAGGIVTRDAQFRARHLLFTPTPYSDHEVGITMHESTARAKRTGNGTLLARYHIVLQEGRLAQYHRLAADEEASSDGRVWYAYLETALPSAWFNNQTYVDTLNPAAIERFAQLTYERYAETVGTYFGTVVPAIFTDEPQFVRKQYFTSPNAAHDLTVPFTSDFVTTFRQTYQRALEDTLPEIFWELPDGQASLTRYQYHDHVAERFVTAYADTLGTWCRAHGIALTGHMMEEATFDQQTSAIGEAMRSYRGFDIPGIDMLCDRHEYVTAKQAQSAAHQYGRSGVVSELYGVTNWDFDFVGHKAQGDWQAALGVTVRVHHLSWVSMAGEAKRDYPASISYQSPWYRQYPLIEDHFARINTALTRGKAYVRVGVIHPIESYWLCFGPLEHTQTEREEREQAFTDITEWLLFGLIDFDFIAESLLPQLLPSPESLGKSFTVGEAAYDVVIVPGMRTIRAATLDRLEAFADAGGRVIFAGGIPSLVNAEPSERAITLAGRTQWIPFTQRRLLEAIAPIREVSIFLSDRRPVDSILHQIRVDGTERYIFFCNVDRDFPRLQTRIILQGEWTVTCLDTLTGATQLLNCSYDNAQTYFTWDFTAHGSLLLKLEPGRSNQTTLSFKAIQQEIARLSDPVAVTLSEPNVLLLDIAEYRLDNGDWQPAEEVLRLDNIVRKQLGYPLRMEAFAQPWINPDRPVPDHTIALRFKVDVSVPVQSPSLALENARETQIFVDGIQIVNDPQGWYTDEAIQTVPLPSLAVGVHALVIVMAYGPLTNVEACYVLGDFGVEVNGQHSRIIAPVRTLSFGSWTTQGLPFYGGNVTYHCKFAVDDGSFIVRVPHFSNPLLTASLNRGISYPIAFAPFEMSLDSVNAGEHQLDITAYGSRVNTFGALHCADKHLLWYGPDGWRTQGDDWAYEYQFRPAGILAAPRLLSVNKDANDSEVPTA